MSKMYLAAIGCCEIPQQGKCSQRKRAELDTNILMFMSSVGRQGEKSQKKKNGKKKIKELRILGQQSAGVQLPLPKGVDKGRTESRCEKKVKAVAV